MLSENVQPMTPLRGAIVGFGGVAVKAHLPVFREDPRFTINAVVEPLAERLELAKQLLPEASVYPDMESLIAANDVDFVDICTPPCFHEDLMLAACKAGLHVFCEKPLLPSADGLAGLRKTAENAGRVLFVVDNWKYAPLWVKVFEIIKENKIGAVKTLSLSVLRTPDSGGGISDWRRIPGIAGGGILLDHGWHNIYLILAAINDYPLGVSAKMGFCSPDDLSLEEISDLLFCFPAADARLHLTRRAGRRRNEGVIIGDKGLIRIDDDHILWETESGDSPVRYDFPEPLSAGSHHPEWMKSVVDSFYREVRTPETAGANFAEAGWCVRLIDLAYRSSREAGRFMGIGPVSAG